MVAFKDLMTLEIEVGPPVSLGVVASAEPRVIPFRSGHFSGETLAGKLLDGGVDWQEVLPDGSLEIRARYLLETDEGERIEIKSEGVRTGSKEVLARLAAGELPDTSEYYFRTAIRLRTSAPRLQRLNGVLAFSVGERRPSSVRLAVYELL